MASKSGPVRPTEPNQMPWLVITCGSKENEPHGLIYVAEFFDSRFANSGSALPRTDMPVDASGPFLWDYYRLDMGRPQTLAADSRGGDPIATREHKSAQLNWDKPEGFTLECRQRVLKESRNGFREVQCKERTNVSREDWNEFGHILLKSKALVEGSTPFHISWAFLFEQITAIRTRRNRASSKNISDTP